jgi:uncharacterized protein YcfL
MVSGVKKAMTLFSVRRLTRAILGASFVAGIALPVWAQAAGDIVVVGNSPSQWGRNQSHWNQLMGLTRPKPSAKGETPGTGASGDPAALQQEMIGNVRVSDIAIQPIIGRSGSSVVAGKVTNNNRKPVTVTSVNFQVFDANGKMLQTEAASPRPATIAPGQSVTFQEVLPTVPADVGATVKVSDPAVTIQGGV